MHGPGHYGINALLFAPFLYVFAMFNQLELALFVGCIMWITARLPDKDIYFDDSFSQGSAILSLVPISHRGITHTVWFAPAVGLVTGAGLAYLPIPGTTQFGRVFVGIFFGTLGITGHLLGDIITPMGLKPLAPASNQKWSFTICTASNFFANSLFFLTGVLACLAAIYFGSPSLPPLADVLAG